MLIPYQNLEKGIILDLIYNPRWGSEKYKILPYYEEANILRFGPIGVFEGCSWVRPYLMEFLPKRSPEEIISDYQKGLMAETFSSPMKEIVYGFTVVKYTEGGLCSSPTTEIIGKKYNYKLQSICGSDDEDFSLHKEIIKSIKLID